MAEQWFIDGHRPNCAYIRSLADITEAYDECDCGEDDDGPEDYWDEDGDDRG